MEKWNKFLSLIDRRVEGFGAQYKTFAIYGLIAYPFGFLLLYYAQSQTNESAIIRLIAVLLCIPLLWTDKWPGKAKKYLNLYWYLTLLYSFPFLATYMCLKNNLSHEWLLNVVLGLFPFILLVEWVSFVILLSIGILLGYLCFIVKAPEFTFDKSLYEVITYLYMYVYVILIGVFFARKGELIQKAKLHMTKMLAGSVAHEMRTPLGAIHAVRYNIDLVIGKYLGKDVDQLVPQSDLLYLEKFSKELQLLVNRSNHTINILLANLRENVEPLPMQDLSMQQCITDNFNQYPFAPGDRELVHLKLHDNFIIRGNEDLIQHIIFNLIQNSLYFIKQVGKGQIFIELERGQENNCLIFKDTAKGVSSKALSQLFTAFYTNRPLGTGLGLSFCKRAVEAMQGKIACTSIEGEHLTFFMHFPKIKE